MRRVDSKGQCFVVDALRVVQMFSCRCLDGVRVPVIRGWVAIEDLRHEERSHVAAQKDYHDPSRQAQAWRSEYA